MYTSDHMTAYNPFAYANIGSGESFSEGLDRGCEPEVTRSHPKWPQAFRLYASVEEKAMLINCLNCQQLTVSCIDALLIGHQKR